MGGAFAYLTWCSLRNRIRVRIRRLREPRYLIGLVAGLLYMYAFVFRHAVRGRARGPAAPGLALAVAQGAAALEALGSAGLFALAVVAWLWPGSRQGLTFTRADVQFLFQAPLTRRQLVQYKLLRSQVGTIFGSAVMTVFLRSGSLEGGWMMMAGLWVMFSIIGLHATGISLSRQSVAQAGLTGLAKQWVPFALLAGAIAVIGGTIAVHATALAALATPREVAAELQRLATTGAAGVVLWPFRAIVRVPLAASSAEFWRALPWAIAMLAANYVWVLRADAAFEEASAMRSEEVAVRLAAIKAGRLSAPRVKPAATAAPTPFALALTGRPETAILWKNLIMVGRYLSLKTLLRLLPLVVLVGVLASRPDRQGGLLPVLAGLCLMGLIFTVLVGPQIARNDLRQDLAQLGVLKTWPVSGPAIVRGEILAPAVVLTAIAWILIVVGALLAGMFHLRPDAAAAVLANRLSYAIAAMLVAPGILLSQLVVQNGIAIVFPAWVAVGASRASGIEATGQRLLMLAGNLITLVLALLPGAIVGGGLALAVYWTTGVVLVFVPALLVAALLLAECWLATEALGRVLERTDVSAVDAAE